MTLRFREDGTLDGFDWTSIGRKLTKYEVDENFATLWAAILALQVALADGVGIDDISVDDEAAPSSFTFTLSDAREFTIPLLLAAPDPKGPWQNGATYFRLDLVDVPGLGQYFLNIPGPYVAPSSGDFDPDVEEGGNKVWKLWGPESGSSVSEITGTTHTVSLADKGKYFRVTNASGCAVTFPDDVDFPKSFEVHFRQADDGSVSFVGSTSVIINPQRDGYDTATAWKGATVTAKYIGDGEWDLIGPHGDSF